MLIDHPGGLPPLVRQAKARSKPWIVRPPLARSKTEGHGSAGTGSRTMFTRTLKTSRGAVAIGVLPASEAEEEDRVARRPGAYSSPDGPYMPGTGISLRRR